MSSTCIDGLKQFGSTVDKAVSGQLEETPQKVIGTLGGAKQHQIGNCPGGCHDNRIVMRLETGSVCREQSLNRTKQNE